MIKYKKYGLNKAITIGEGVVQGATGEPRPTKCNWFCRNVSSPLKRLISNSGLDFGGLLSAAIDWFGTLRTDYALEEFTEDITPSEAEHFEYWFPNVFFPKYERMMIKGDQIFKTTDAITQIKLINELNKELATTRAFLNWDNPKLSIIAETQRNQYCSLLISEIEKIIFDSLEASPNEYLATNVTFKSSPILLMPIVSHVVFDVTATEYSISETIQNPNQTDPIDSSIGSENTASTTSSENTESKKGNGLLTLGAIAIGGVILGKLVSR